MPLIHKIKTEQKKPQTEKNNLEENYTMKERKNFKIKLISSKR